MKQYSVLVIEDNAASRLLLGHQINALGSDSVTAGSLSEATDWLHIRPIHFIFIDLHLGDNQDFDHFATEISQLKRHPQIIGITATLDSEAQQICSLLGINEILSKPIQTEVLRAVLDDLDHKGKTEDQIQTQHNPDFLDERRLEEMRELAKYSGPESIEKVILSFNQNSQQRLLKLWQAIISKDYKTIHQVCHGWRGIAASLGANELADMLEDLEMNQQQQYSDLIAQFSKIKNSYKDSSKALDAFKATLGT